MEVISSRKVAMMPKRLHQDCKGLVLLGVLLGILWDTGCAQIHYLVPVELEKSSRVGNIAKDLGLEPQELEECRAQSPYSLQR